MWKFMRRHTLKISSDELIILNTIVYNELTLAGKYVPRYAKILRPIFNKIQREGKRFSNKVRTVGKKSLARKRSL